MKDIEANKTEKLIDKSLLYGYKRIEENKEKLLKQSEKIWKEDAVKEVSKELMELKGEAKRIVRNAVRQQTSLLLTVSKGPCTF